MPPQGFDQALLSKLFLSSIERFGKSIRIECQGIAGMELTFLNRTIPFLEKAHYRAGGVQPFEIMVVTQQKTGMMSTIRVS